MQLEAHSVCDYNNSPKCTVCLCVCVCVGLKLDPWLKPESTKREETKVEPMFQSSVFGRFLRSTGKLLASSHTMPSLRTEGLSCIFPTLHMRLHSSLIHPTNTKAAFCSVLPLRTTRQLTVLFQTLATSCFLSKLSQAVASLYRTMRRSYFLKFLQNRI